MNNSRDIGIFLKALALRQSLNAVYDLILFLKYIGFLKNWTFAQLSHLFWDKNPTENPQFKWIFLG